MKREAFKAELAAVNSGQAVVFIDESGVIETQGRQYNYSVCGQNRVAFVSGKRGKRINLIAGLLNGKLVAGRCFSENCNADIFKNWLVKYLFPKIPKGSIVIMDNARFHHFPDMQSIFQKAGMFFKKLPPYSPDLNPIEHCWHTIKSYARKHADTAFSFQECLEYIMNSMEN